MASSRDELVKQCHAIVDRLYSSYGLSLLPRDELIARTLGAYDERPDASLRYLMFGLYNEVLYHACRGDDGLVSWEQGYRELQAMLALQARARYPEFWEDAVQIALEITCQRMERCRVPQAFFKFAWGHLRNAVRSVRAHGRGAGDSLEVSLDGPVYYVFRSDVLADTHAMLEEQLLGAEQRAELRAILDALEREQPRARRQLLAVRLKFLDGLDDHQIGESLGVPVKRVHELRSLGLKRLRADPRLKRLFGIDADEAD